MKNPIPNTVRSIIVGAWIVGLIWFENRRALRSARRNKFERDVRNLMIAAAAGTVMQGLEMPVAFQLAELAERRRLGACQLLPARVRGCAGILLLDYTLYWWHVLTHRVPALWRFHQVHHIDQEMDATTALRFHFGEIAISVAYRAVQVAVIGPTPMALAAWQLFLFLCILFHHSNVRLPLFLERRLAHLLVTPRLHAIHHSIAANESNSNWSSGLTVWDWLHRTLRTEAPQEKLTLGVRGYLDPGQDTVGKALLLPFQAGGDPPEYDGKAVRQPLGELG